MTTAPTPRKEEIAKRLAAAAPGERDLQRLDGHSEDSFRYEVMLYGHGPSRDERKGGHVAFYEDSFDEPMRAKFEAELYFHAPADLRWCLEQLDQADAKLAASEAREKSMREAIGVAERFVARAELRNDQCEALKLMALFREALAEAQAPKEGA